MADLTRRGFLTQTSITAGVVGVGIASGLGLRHLVEPLVKPSGANAALPSAAPATVSTAGLALAGLALPDSMIVHVRDLATGEIAVMVDTQEFIYHDPELVARLVMSAVPSATAEG